jgi:poly-beta-hydroxyalkanoate depolymerase
LVQGKEQDAQVTKTVYDKYPAVLDRSVAFYLQTVASILQEYALPPGALAWRG